MANNWWENVSVPGSWGDVKSGARSWYDSQNNRMDILNPGGGSFFVPLNHPAQLTGWGHTSNVPGLSGALGTPGNFLTGGTDPFYGYGDLFGFGGGGGGGGQRPGQSSAVTMNNMTNTGTGNVNFLERPGQSAMGVSSNNPVWNPGGLFPGGPGGYGGPNTIGNVTYSGLSNQELLLDKLFKGAVTGQGGGPLAGQLFNFALGRLPRSMAEGIIGQTNESFGKLGARFGTDLGTAQARGLAQAAEQQSLNAISQILGLGGTTAGFQFQRGENALDRAMREYIAKLQSDPMNNILSQLLGGGF